MRKVLALFVFLLMISITSHASVRQVSISEPGSAIPSRWMLGLETPKRFSKTVLGNLKRLKQFHINKDYRKCFDLARNNREKISNLKHWIVLYQLICARNAFENKEVKPGRLSGILKLIDRNSRFLVSGPQSDRLRREYIKGRFTLLQSDIRKNRQRAWVSVDRLIDLIDWVPFKDRADVFKLAGELAFIEQKMPAAKGFVMQSLALEESSELREKLSTIEKALGRKVEEKEKENESNELKYQVADEKYLAKDFDTSRKNEENLTERVRVALRSGDLVSAAEDAIKLIQGFPGGTRANWARDRIREIFLRSTRGKGVKISNARDKVVQTMTKAEGLDLLDWTRLAFRRGLFADAVVLAAEAAKKLNGTDREKKAQLVVALSSLFLGELKDAENGFVKIVKSSAGSEEAKESLFRLGLLHFRKKEYSTAASYLEKVLFLKDADRYQLSAHYWLWRSFERLNNRRAKEERDRLITLYPLTYFGLRARLEKTNGNMEIPLGKKDAKPRKIDLWLTDRQRLAWERFKVLMKVGWLNEARAELGALAPPKTDREKKVIARYWAHALDYRKTIRLAQDVWPQPERLLNRDYIDLSFPMEFSEVIEAEGKKNGVSKPLIQGLIRQESSYFVEAISRAGARGLMQLLPSTAEEVARQLDGKKKTADIKETLFDVRQNIRLGTKYLNKMIRRYDGNIPLALAAYNAGPTRLSRWLRVRGDSIPGGSKAKTSDPFYELWMEEIPWPETRHYVKSVLRNYIVYRYLDYNQVHFTDPVWN